MTDNGTMPLIENAFAAIVITAETFNPSIFTETWLVRNEIIAPDAFVGLRVFSPEVAQFQTADIQQVLVIPPKMQITFGIHDVEGDFQLPRKVAVRTVELLPHTPYQALGLNFDFFVAQPADQDFYAYNRNLFGSGDCQLLREFSSSDTRFGRYFSKDYGEGRLRLDIKPARAGPENKELLRFSFNFHHEVSQLSPDDRVRKLTQVLRGWDSLRQYAQRLVGLGSILRKEGQ